MKKERWFQILIGMVALVLITVLLVGILNGVWPWTKGSYFGDYKINLKNEETQQQTEENQSNSTEGSVQVTESTNSGATTDADIKIPLETEESIVNTTETVSESVEETTKTPGSEQEISFADLPQ